MKKSILFSLFFIFSLSAFSQVKELKEQAIQAFKEEHYPKAIELLKQAEKQNQNDAEIYYLLGFYTLFFR